MGTTLEHCICKSSSVLVNASIENNGEYTISEIWCPDYNDCCFQLLEDLSFWVEGVAQLTFAIVGILMNTACCCVLLSKNLRNVFNLLLIALVIFDSGFLLGSILEVFRKGSIGFDLVSTNVYSNTKTYLRRFVFLLVFPH